VRGSGAEITPPFFLDRPDGHGDDMVSFSSASKRPISLS